ncbi:hypothetical protein, partial [Sphingomonas sp.]|uniref:hypothetical protein n=1 Tax=Sphingomonas sp. TaxID=28214 RepID=UPI002DD63C29
QHPNDLILGKSASPHRSSPSDELTYQWHEFWGAGQTVLFHYSQNQILALNKSCGPMKSGALDRMNRWHLTLTYSRDCCHSEAESASSMMVV